jgi:hypothetical protein
MQTRATTERAAQAGQPDVAEPALAIPPLWVFTPRAFGGGTKAAVAASLVCVAYALSFALVPAVAFDFHEVAFAPVLIMIALERFQAGRLRSALIALVFLLLVERMLNSKYPNSAITAQRARNGSVALACAVAMAGVTLFTVLMWDGEQPPLGSPWIVADPRRKAFTFKSVAEQKARIALLQTEGYQVVFRRDGYLVLHRAGHRAASPNSQEDSG